MPATRSSKITKRQPLLLPSNPMSEIKTNSTAAIATSLFILVDRIITNSTIEPLTPQQSSPAPALRPSPLRPSPSHFSLLTSLPSLPETGLHRHPSSESEMALLKGSTGLLWNDREFRGQSGRRDFLQEGIAARNFLRRRNFSYSQAFWPEISYRRLREAGKDEPHTRGEWRLRGRRLPHL